jgi:hypothetical protein
MLSSFLKKLLFARQFFMIDGKIEVLGKRQVMLPADVVEELQKSADKKSAKALKESMKKDMAEYAKKVGGSEEGMLNNIQYILETFGLGKIEIVDIDHKSSKCLIRVNNPPMGDGLITSAVLGGTFSFLFGKDVDAQVKSHSKGYSDYVVK